MTQLHAWLGEQGVFQSEFVFLSRSNNDGEALAKEAKAKDFFVPNYLRRWIDLKKAFPINLFDSTKRELDFD